MHVPGHLPTTPHIELADKYSHCGEAPCGCLLTHDDEGTPMIYLCHTHNAAPALRAALGKIGAVIESPCDPLSVLRKIGRIQAAASAQIPGQDQQQPKPGEITFCPYCGSSNIEAGQSAFVEMGRFQGSYDSEGNAEGCLCKDCLGEFWINGPEMPAKRPEATTDETAA